MFEEEPVDRSMVMCPGCGLKLPGMELAINERYRASEQCVQLYGELTAYNLEKQDIAFTHQMSVDAYGAQHSGGPTGNLRTAFSLVGLYLAFEKGFTGRQVQKAHMELAKRSIDWPRMEPPDGSYMLTIMDVLQAEPEVKRDAMHRKWAEDVWRNWEHMHAWTRDICRQFVWR